MTLCHIKPMNPTRDCSIRVPSQGEQCVVLCKQREEIGARTSILMNDDLSINGLSLLSCIF